MAVHWWSKMWWSFMCLLWLKIEFVSCFDCKNGDQKLQVHIVPHTHDDVGWLKTVDQYFYGAERLIQAGAVQYILDTAVDELQKNPNRTFIYVEMAFFKRWWDEKNDEIKNIVKILVKNKQLEFINGGWSMNDEGATHYNGIIDQMTLGLLFIEEHFGTDARPTIAWQIDPFGHSAEQASLFSLMSLDGLFFGRLDEADKRKRKREQRMELVWRGSRNYGKDSQIFTGVLYNGYNPPPGFCYDEFCEDPPIQDDPNMYDMNVKERVDAFVEVTCEQAEHYKTNHIILTMGSDFQFENARRWFFNLDKLIRYVNEDGRIHAFYSTPSRYLKALHDANKKWEVKTDDFFPYAHCDHCYWTGYFTSRPTLKGYIRESNNILQACKQMESMEGLVDFPSSRLLRRAVAVNQHHDAVTGTEKQPVANDYAKRLYIGREECKSLMSKYIKNKINKGSSQRNKLNFTYCDFLNVSMCHTTEKEDSIVLNVYNPTGRGISTYVRLPVNSREYSVVDPYEEIVQSQVSLVSLETSKIRRDSHGSASYELTFEVSAPPLGYATFFIKKTAPGDNLATFSVESVVKEGSIYIENDNLKLEFSSETGRLVRMGRKDEDLHIDVEQQFLWYNASVGNDKSIQTSGAYIFRPNRSEPFDVCELNIAKIYVTKGPVYEEVRQTFGTYVSQVIRLYKHENYAEFEHTVGPIPVGDGHGKEIITRFDTGIETVGKFYTDANGREMKERIRNHRDTWKMNITEPVAGNYYPVNSRIFINDSSTQLTVMSDRSQGGSSIVDGSIEIMVHRRLLKDDFLGVGEALNEPGLNGEGLVTRGKHRVLLTTPKNGASLHRENGVSMMMGPVLSFSKNEYDMKQWNESFAPIHSGLMRLLPDNIHLLTLESITRDEIILRFENYYEKFERDGTVEINLDGLFKAFKITTLTEMNLSANQKLSEKRMWNWNTGEEQYHPDVEINNKSGPLVIRLKPMEIRTYRANIEFFASLPTTRNEIPKNHYENNGYVVF